MKFNSYEEYLDYSKAYYSKIKDLKVPIEYMLFTKELFDLFNGEINIGEQKCNGECRNCDCHS